MFEWGLDAYRTDPPGNGVARELASRSPRSDEQATDLLIAGPAAGAAAAHLSGARAAIL